MKGRDRSGESGEMRVCRHASAKGGSIRGEEGLEGEREGDITGRVRYVRAMLGSSSRGLWDAGGGRRTGGRQRSCMVIMPGGGPRDVTREVLERTCRLPLRLGSGTVSATSGSTVMDDDRGMLSSTDGPRLMSMSPRAAIQCRLEYRERHREYKLV